MVGVKDLVAGHDGHQIFRFRQIGDAVRPAGDHVDSLDLIARDLKLHRFAGIDIALPDQAVTGHHDEQLPLGVVPVLALGDAGTADVNGYLSAVGGVQQLRKGAAVVRVHLQGVLEPVSGEIGQVQGIELFGKGAFRHFRHHEGGRLPLEFLQQVHDLAQCDLVGGGHAAIAAIRPQDRLHTVELAVRLPALQQVKHTLHQIVDVQQLQLSAAVVDGKRLVVGHRPAERADGAVVVGATVAHQVGEAVDRHLGAALFGIREEQFLASLLTAAILTAAEAPGQRGLNGGGQHDGSLIVMLLQAVQEVGGKAEVALHEVFRVFRTVHPCQIEHEIGLPAVFIQLLRGGVQVILIDLVNMDVRAGPVFAVPEVFQVIAQGGAHHALGACDKDVHMSRLLPVSRARQVRPGACPQMLGMPFSAFCT